MLIVCVPATREMPVGIPEDRDKSPPRLNQPPGGQQRLAEQRQPVSLAPGQWLALDVERLSHAARRHQRPGQLLKAVEGLHSLMFVQPLPAVVELLDERAPES